MAHVKKYAKSALGHMACHFARAVDEHGNYLKFGNQDIDPAKTHLNYNLAPEHDGGQVAFIQQRCHEVRCLKRDDVKVMCSWVLTAPLEIAGGEHEREFFQKSYDFMAKRYGEENVVSAYVHQDENTPHMHFAFVPVTRDRKRGDWKVSAKEVVTKTDLKTFHQDLDKNLSLEMGERYPGGILNGATLDGNKSVRQLKAETVERAQEQAKEIVSDARTEAKELSDRLAPLRAEYNARTAFIDQSVKDSDVSMMYPDYVKTKGLGQKYVVVPRDKWEAKHVSANQIGALRKERAALEKGIRTIQSTDYARENRRLRDTVDEQQEQIYDLKGALQQAQSKLKKVFRVLESNPELAEKYNEQVEFLQHRQNRSFDLEL